MRALAVATLLLVAAASDASAQLRWSFSTAAYSDAADTRVIGAAVTVAPARPGWSPLATASAYWARVARSDTQRDLLLVTPAVGFINQFGRGAFQARAGYTMASGADVAPVLNAQSSGSGVVNGAQIDYWGSGAVAAHAAVDYNYGSQAFSSHARVTARLAQFGQGDVRAGPEFHFAHGGDYRATRIGGVLGVTIGRRAVNLALGQQDANAGNVDGTYVGIELVFR